MLWRKVVTIALFLLVSACIAEKEDVSAEDDDDGFYDSRGESSNFLLRKVFMQEFSNVSRSLKNKSDLNIAFHLRHKKHQ